MKKKEEITGALIGLAKTCNMHGRGKMTTGIILYALGKANPASDVSDEELDEVLGRIREEKRFIAPDCEKCQARCGNSDDYNLDLIQNDTSEIRSLKYALLDKIYEEAARSSALYMEERLTKEKEDYFYRALCAVSYDMDAERYRKLL